MDKFAEQINRDIYTLAMYKLANWSKIAEGEPVPPPPPQEDFPPQDRRDYDPRAYSSPEEAAAAAMNQLHTNLPFVPDKETPPTRGGDPYPAYTSIDGRLVNSAEGAANIAAQMAGGLPPTTPYGNYRPHILTDMALMRRSPEYKPGGSWSAYGMYPDDRRAEGPVNGVMGLAGGTPGVIPVESFAPREFSNGSTGKQSDIAYQQYLPLMHNIERDPYRNQSPNFSDRANSYADNTFKMFGPRSNIVKDMGIGENDYFRNAGLGRFDRDFRHQQNFD